MYVPSSLCNNFTVCCSDISKKNDANNIVYKSTVLKCFTFILNINLMFIIINRTPVNELSVLRLM